MRQEIPQRTQGKKESVSDYLNCIWTMFDRLIPKMPEAKEIRYAHRNLLPKLHLAIQRNQMRTSHLEYLAHDAERRYQAAKDYKPSPLPGRSSFPELAYRDPWDRGTDRQPDRRLERERYNGLAIPKNCVLRRGSPQNVSSR